MAIGVDSYLFHLVKKIVTSPAQLVIMLVYIDRYVSLGRPFNSRTAHRLCLSAFVLSHKYTQDVTFKLSGFAAVGGVSAKEMAGLERELLEVLDFHMFVNEETFTMYQDSLLKMGE